MTTWRNEQGALHRVGGPAVIWTNGTQAWYLNGELHRVNGPAVTHEDGYQAWFRNDKLHRTNGPAVIYANGAQEWWVNGQQLTDFEVWVLAGAKEHV